MSQVAQVRPGLYLSGSDPALRLSVLSSRSISLVVNASGLQDLVYPPLEGLSVLNVPLQDQPHAPLKLYFDLVGERIHQKPDRQNSGSLQRGQEPLAQPHHRLPDEV
ncbi:hypothetical protein CgunFtcFv8_010081 [Champsocephalus gunnari]|uniref:Uncharacterized protein n=1 Tax=Champsocephalus gunnari TaxID=52237 RepID=A0AAN8DUG7_CHAGU|nr:hypothetical protein CgunFtcFv8_010081 [Champsocephalus gunnari]